MIRKILIILLSLGCFVSLGIIAYPFFSDYWNSFHQTRAAAVYTEAVNNTDKEKNRMLKQEAVEYNQSLLENMDRFRMSEGEYEAYEAMLDVSGNGVMSFLEIPSIDVALPVYHGTDEAVLQVAAGHLAGSSLPVGGAGTHAVISGHCGLPSATLFSNLDQLKEGDLFWLTTLDETLYYEVDQILVVKPEQTSELAIDPKQDYVTLVTCTPYGVNSHRLLVRGRRCDAPDQESEAEKARSYDTALVLKIAAGVLAAMVLAVMLWLRKRRRS